VEKDIGIRKHTSKRYKRLTRQKSVRGKAKRLHAVLNLFSFATWGGGEGARAGLLKQESLLGLECGRRGILVGRHYLR